MPENQEILAELKDIKSINEELLKEMKLLRKNLIDTIAKGFLLGLIVAGLLSAIFTACVSIMSM